MRRASSAASSGLLLFRAPLGDQHLMLCARRRWASSSRSRIVRSPPPDAASARVRISVASRKPILRREQVGQLQIVRNVGRLCSRSRPAAPFRGRSSVSLCAAALHSTASGSALARHVRVPMASSSFESVDGALQHLLVVAALLNRLLDAQLRDRLGRFFVARLGLLDAPPAADRLIELAEPRQRLGRPAIDRHILRRCIERPAQARRAGIRRCRFARRPRPRRAAWRCPKDSISARRKRL